MQGISVDINNGQIMRLTQSKHDGIIIMTSWGIEVLIQPGELVMLMNYYRNCKDGKEESNYIKP
jgi:hypothetical protein